VEVARGRELFASASRAASRCRRLESARPRTGAAPASPSRPTLKSSHGGRKFKPARLYRLARSKAYLFAGVENQGNAIPSLISDGTPAEAVFQFPGGLSDHLKEQVGDRGCATADFFSGRQDFAGDMGMVEWAVAWPLWSEGGSSFYCNTIPTPDGGTHEQGMRAALTRGMRAFGELAGRKGQGHPGRGCCRRGGNHAVRLHPRPPVSKPDQGPPHQP
jgi:topoisomerase-4 subunit B